ncbi:MAG: hypothetical protein WAK82_09925 [Streptosporangiaceae bacterium]
MAVLTAILIANAGSSSLKLWLLSETDSVPGSADLPARGAANTAEFKEPSGHWARWMRPVTGSCTAGTCSTARR